MLYVRALQFSHAKGGTFKWSLFTCACIKFEDLNLNLHPSQEHFNSVVGGGGTLLKLFPLSVSSMSLLLSEDSLSSRLRFSLLGGFDREPLEHCFL